MEQFITHESLQIPPQELLESAYCFAEYLTDKWPQTQIDQYVSITDIDETEIGLPPLPECLIIPPKLNYYIGGSLAVILLAQADTVDICAETYGSSITIENTISIPQKVKDTLVQFARPIGDLDYVPTTDYKNLPERLRKGGGGPSYDELPAKALPIIQRKPNQIKVMCDPLETYGTKKFARICIRGKEFYIARPDTLIAYKIFHILQNYPKKPEKFNRDFATLSQALMSMYPLEHLLPITHHLLAAYEEEYNKIMEYFSNGKPYDRKLPKLFDQVMQNPQLSPEIRYFLEALSLFNQDQGSHLL